MTALCAHLSASQVSFWDNVLQGSAGSVISIMGIIIAFLLTRRHDRSLQKTEHERDAKTQRTHETAEIVTQVVRAGLPLQGSKPLESPAEQCRELSRELTLLGVRLAHYYPGLQQWTQHQSNDLNDIAWAIAKAEESLDIEVTSCGTTTRPKDCLKENTDTDEEPEPSLAGMAYEELVYDAARKSTYIVTKLVVWASFQFIENANWTPHESDKEAG